MSIYIARFTPEAWINDEAVEVDALGEREWDCTTAVNAHTDYFAGLGWEYDSVGDCLTVLDRDDVLKTDPEAPSWVREWSGPFTIRVRQEPDPGSDEEARRAQQHRTSAIERTRMAQALSDGANIPLSVAAEVLAYLRDTGDVDLTGLAGVNAPEVTFDAEGLPHCPYDECPGDRFECIEIGGYTTEIDFERDAGDLVGRVGSDHAETSTAGYACCYCGGVVDIPDLELVWA